MVSTFCVSKMCIQFDYYFYINIGPFETEQNYPPGQNAPRILDISFLFDRQSYSLLNVFQQKEV